MELKKEQAGPASLVAELGRRIRLSSIYVTGEVLTAAISLLLLPIYTAYLSPAEYGNLALAMVIMSIATTVFALGFDGSILKFYFDLEKEKLETYLGSVWLVFIVFPGGLLFLIEMTKGRIFDLLFTQITYQPYIRMVLWIAFIAVALGTLPRQIFRASEKAGAFIVLNTAQFGITAILTVWLIGFLGLGVRGALWAQLFAVGITGFIGSLFILKSVHFGLDISLIKKGFNYGFPLVPHFLAHWILGASDRVILERFVSLAEVGIYSVAYQVGSVMMLFVIAGGNSLYPLFGRLNKESQVGAEKINKIISYYFLALTSIGLVIAAFAKELIGLIASSGFSGAWPVVPLVVLGFLFMGLYVPSMAIITLVQGDTRTLGIFTIAAAILNVFLNLMFIPRFGMMAAAGTTAVSYFALCFMFTFFSQRVWSVAFEYRRVASIFFAAVAAFFAGQGGPFTGFPGEFAWKGFSLMLFPVILCLVGFLNPKEKYEIGRVVLYFKNRLA